MISHKDGWRSPEVSLPAAVLAPAPAVVWMPGGAATAGRRIPGETIQACPENESDSAECASATVQQVKRLGEEARLVLGFQQAGAAGATDEQKFFFDFYISRPLPFGNNDEADPDSRLSWWGNVRVSSTPEQINSPLSSQAITSAAKGLKINQLAQSAEFLLAQSAEFLSGLDFRLGRFLCPLWSQSSNTKMRSALFLTIGAGATGPLTTAASSTNTFYALNPADSDYPRLLQNYPQVAKYDYISFIAPSRNQYDIEYFGGVKLVTHYADSHGTAGTGPPAIVSFTVGQNELVSGGELRGVVSRVEGFFPLSTGQSGLLSSIYLFGNAQLRLHSAQNLQPYNFAPATGTPPLSETLFVATPQQSRCLQRWLGA
jgi:hypothetical protein